MSQETAYEKCVRIRMEAGAPREEAELACQDKKTDQDEEKTPWQKCIQKHMAEGLDKEQARMKCKEEGVAQDQAETPWQKCIAKHLKEGMSMEEAADKCKQEGVAQDIEEPAEPKETAPSPLETCIATRMEAQGEDEATAKKWCEDELAGLHAPAEAIVDSIKKLQAKDAQLKKR